MVWQAGVCVLRWAIKVILCRQTFTAILKDTLDFRGLFSGRQIPPPPATGALWGVCAVSLYLVKFTLT